LKERTLYAGISALLVVVILVVAFSLGVFSGSGQVVSTTGSSVITSETNSIQGANQTYVATYVNSLNPPTALTTSLTTTTSTSSTSSSTSTQSLSTGAAFTYTPSSQVKVLSVSAMVSGSSIIGFSAQFQNIGTDSINVLTGGGSSLDSSITTGAANVMVVTGPRCEIAEALSPVSPGGEWTAITPGCWSGYHYELLTPGTIGVQLTLTWSGGTGGSLQIYAEFSLS
jgi:hypothetical protein